MTDLWVYCGVVNKLVKCAECKKKIAEGILARWSVIAKFAYFCDMIHARAFVDKHIPRCYHKGVTYVAWRLSNKVYADLAVDLEFAMKHE